LIVDVPGVAHPVIITAYKVIIVGLVLNLISYPPRNALK
jgi:hypothetical protein